MLCQSEFLQRCTARPANLRAVFLHPYVRLYICTRVLFRPTEHELAGTISLRDIREIWAPSWNYIGCGRGGEGFGLSHKEVMGNRESFRRSRGDWPDQTAEANLVLFLDGFRRPVHPDQLFLFRRIKTWILPRGWEVGKFLPALLILVTWWENWHVSRLASLRYLKSISMKRSFVHWFLQDCRSRFRPSSPSFE